jgi:hypothetical protein
MQERAGKEYAEVKKSHFRRLLDLDDEKRSCQSQDYGKQNAMRESAMAEPVLVRDTQSKTDRIKIRGNRTKDSEEHYSQPVFFGSDYRTQCDSCNGMTDDCRQSFSPI